MRGGRSYGVAGNRQPARHVLLRLGRRRRLEDRQRRPHLVPHLDDPKGIPIGSIGAIAVAPSNPNIVYVGTGEPDIRSQHSYGIGMYKSTDAGKTWTHIGLEDTEHIGTIAVDPTNPNRVYVAALGHVYDPNPERGLYRSIDGGSHLEEGPLQRQLPNDVGAIDVAIDPKNPKVLYASLWAHAPSAMVGLRPVQPARRRTL